MHRAALLLQLAGFASNRSHNIDEETLQGKVRRSQGTLYAARNTSHYVLIIQLDGRVYALIVLRSNFDSRYGDRSRRDNGAFGSNIPIIYMFINSLCAQNSTAPWSLLGRPNRRSFRQTRRPFF
jgi:hypothetical protein